jgi:tRNA pseudouridine55 synthase
VKPSQMESGILLLDKPAGLTSFGVVARSRKMLGTRRVGHLGTLDPFATGILPLVFGKATRLSQYLMEHDKRYRVTLELGLATDTLDREGKVVGEKQLTPEHLQHLLQDDCKMIKQAVADLEGAREQVPPMYSAKILPATIAIPVFASSDGWSEPITGNLIQLSAPVRERRE